MNYNLFQICRVQILTLHQRCYTKGLFDEDAAEDEEECDDEEQEGNDGEEVRVAMTGESRGTGYRGGKDVRDGGSRGWGLEHALPEQPPPPPPQPPTTAPPHPHPIALEGLMELEAGTYVHRHNTFQPELSFVHLKKIK